VHRLLTESNLSLLFPPQVHVKAHKRGPRTKKSHHKKLRGKGWFDTAKAALPHVQGLSKALGVTQKLKDKGGYAGAAGHVLGALGFGRPRRHRMRRC